MMLLIKLELQKFKMGQYVRSVMLANLIIAGIMILIGFEGKLEGEIPFVDIQESLVVIGILVRATFVIFASVLIAKLIIEEYKRRTITVLFTYPVNRKRLITAKLVLIGILTLSTTILSNIFVAFVFISFNQFFQFIPGQLSLNFMATQSLTDIVFAVGTTGTSLISLYFGMRNHSVPATIVSAIVIVMLISSYNQSGIGIGGNIYVPLLLATFGILIALLTVRRVDKVDV